MEKVRQCQVPSACEHLKMVLKSVSWGYTACKCEVDIHFLGHLENKNAGVLQTPLNVRDNKVRFGREVVFVNMNLHGHRKVTQHDVICMLRKATAIALEPRGLLDSRICGSDSEAGDNRVTRAGNDSEQNRIRMRHHWPI